MVGSLFIPPSQSRTHSAKSMPGSLPAAVAHAELVKELSELYVR